MHFWKKEKPNLKDIKLDNPKDYLYQGIKNERSCNC